MSDTNFDNLLPRFQRNIYTSAKGRIRLAILNRDFEENVVNCVDLETAHILDAGAGTGEFSVNLAEKGARVVLSDISANMLAAAEERFRTAQVATHNVVLILNALIEIISVRSGAA